MVDLVIHHRLPGVLPVTREGDQVYLSWKQLVGILGTIILAAVGAAGVPAKFLYDQNERLTIVETRQKMNEEKIDNNRQSIDKLNNHAATLARIEQLLSDVSRRIERLEEMTDKRSHGMP